MTMYAREKCEKSCMETNSWYKQALLVSRWLGHLPRGATELGLYTVLVLGRYGQGSIVWESRGYFHLGWRAG